MHRLGWGLTMRGIGDFVSLADGSWAAGQAPWDIPLRDIPHWIVALGAQAHPAEERTIVEFTLSNGDDLVWCDLCEGTDAEWLQVRNRRVIDAYCHRCIETRKGLDFDSGWVTERLVEEASAIVARTAAYYADPFRARMREQDDHGEAAAA
jgi:hypothetical protein